MKVLMVSNQYPPYFLGGDANSSRLLSEELVKRGEDVTVISNPKTYSVITGESLSDTENYDKNGVKVKPVHYSYFDLIRNILGYLPRNKEEIKIIKEDNPDIIHLQNFSSFGIGLLKKLNKMDFPTIMTVRDNWLICPSRARVRECTKGCFGCKHNKYKLPINFPRKYIKYIDHMVFPSRSYQEMFTNQFGEILPDNEVIPNITRDWPDVFDFGPREKIRDELGIKEEDTVVLYVGHLTKAKGIDSLVRASKDLEGVKFLFAGMDKEGILEDTPEKENIIDMGFLPSFSKELFRLYYISDIFLLPTRWDNCPLTVLEAMSFGLPILATKVGGVPELVRDGKNGRLFELDDLKRLNKILRRFIEEEDLEKMGQKSREFFESNYSVNVGLEKYMNVYEDIL